MLDEEVPCDFTCGDCVRKCGPLQYYPHLLYTDSKEDEGKSQESTEHSTVTSTSTGECSLKAQKKVIAVDKKEVLFWKPGWRKNLCKCPDCLTEYQKAQMEFIVDESDMKELEVVDEEETDLEETAPEGDRKRPFSLLQQGEEAFLKSSIPHVVKLDLISASQCLSSELKAYIRSLHESGVSTITKEVTFVRILLTIQHIDQFFSDKLPKKRRYQ